jgi:hypothetical protein
MKEERKEENTGKESKKKEKGPVDWILEAENRNISAFRGTAPRGANFGNAALPDDDW